MIPHPRKRTVMQRAALVLATVALASASAFAAAPDRTIDAKSLFEPSRAELRRHPILAKLQKPINASYVDTPLESVIDHLQRHTSVTIVLDRKALGKSVRKPIDLVLEGAPAGEVLYWVLRLAHLDFEIRGQVLFVSTRSTFMAGRVQLKMYNLIDMTMTLPDFPGPRLMLGRETSLHASSSEVDLQDPASNQIFEAGSFAELIQAWIDPESWAAELGTSIDERGGHLIVIQTPEVHRRIAQFLGELRASMGMMIALRMRVLRLSPRILDDMLGTRARSPYLSAAEVKRVEELIRTRQAEVVATLRTTCHNKQRVYAFGGDEQTYIADYDIAGAVFDPIIGQLHTGAVLEVRPTLIQDSGRVKLDLRIQISQPVSLYTFYPIGGAREDEGHAPWDPQAQRFRRKPRPAAKESTRLAPGALELPTIDVAHVETTLVCPLGGTAFFTLEDPERAEGEKRREFMVLVTPRMVRFGAPAALEP